MQIRSIQKEDRPRILEMMQVFYASDALLIHPDLQVLERTVDCALAENGLVDAFVFDTGDALAGYGMVTKCFSTEAGGICVWIEDIYIEPPYRGKGLGSSFLKFVEERYRKEAVRLRLEAEPENERAMTTYQKAGFQELGYTQLYKQLQE